MTAPFPAKTSERSAWVASLRPARNHVDAKRPYAFLLEEEPTAKGKLATVATVFLTNRECPWRCVMCDLWKNTVTETVPAGAIPAQIKLVNVAEAVEMHRGSNQPQPEKS